MVLKFLRWYYRTAGPRGCHGNILTFILHIFIGLVVTAAVLTGSIGSLLGVIWTLIIFIHMLNPNVHGDNLTRMVLVALPLICGGVPVMGTIGRYVMSHLHAPYEQLRDKARDKFGAN